MAVRLSKVAREFNVGLSTIVDYLQEKGPRACAAGTSG